MSALWGSLDNVVPKHELDPQAFTHCHTLQQNPGEWRLEFSQSTTIYLNHISTFSVHKGRILAENEQRRENAKQKIFYRLQAEVIWADHGGKSTWIDMLSLQSSSTLIPVKSSFSHKSIMKHPRNINSQFSFCKEPPENGALDTSHGTILEQEYPRFVDR